MGWDGTGRDRTGRDATNFHASENSPFLILGAMSELRTFVPSGRDFIGMGPERRLTF